MSPGRAIATMPERLRETSTHPAMARAGFDGELPQPSPERIGAAIEASSAGYLRPVWSGLALVYAFFAAAHLLLLPPGIRLPMFLLAGISAVGFGAGTLWLRRVRFPGGGKGATCWSGWTGLVIWLNSAVHLILVGQPKDSTNLIIVLIGIAIFLLDRRWFLGVAFLCVGAWVLAFLRSPPDPQWSHFGFAFLSSGLLAGLIHIGRRRDLERIQGLLMVEEKREALLEAALQDARLRLASIWQNSRDGLIISDAEGRVVAVNRAVAALVGRTEAELCGRPWLEFLAEGWDREAANRIYAQTYLNPESVTAEEREVALASGRRAWLATSHLRLPQLEGPPLLLTLVRDVTERRKFDEERRSIERRMLEAQRLESLGVLAGGIAHDFNNLLAGILGHVELTSTQLPAEAPAQRHLVLARTAAERAADLCQQMLAYAGQGRFVERDLDLNEIVTETRELLGASLPRNSRVELELASDLPGVRADPTRLRQVMMNLMMNGSEAMEERGGVLRVKTRTAPVAEVRAADPTAGPLPEVGFVCLEVRDEGCGMSEETRSRIFEPFFTTKFAGRGLGLSAVLGIVKAHHGGLSVESAPGAGSVFRVYLPALAWVVAPAGKPPPVPRTWRGEGTVLVVDDEPFVREVLCEHLQRVGFVVRLAEDGAEGLEILRAEAGAVRLMFLDLTMPRLDGPQTMEAMQSLAVRPPVILMSGYAETEIHRRFDAFPPAGFLQKPFNMAQLVERIRQVLGAGQRPP